MTILRSSSYTTTIPKSVNGKRVWIKLRAFQRALLRSSSKGHGMDWQALGNFADYWVKQPKFAIKRPKFATPKHPSALTTTGGVLISIKRNLLGRVATLLNSDKVVNKGHESFKGMDDTLNKIRWFYYSAHDTSISPILGAFNSVDMKWPPYRSNIIIELWKSKV